jgi:hypothetical protein
VRKNDGGDKSKIYYKHIHKYHNVSPIQLLYANKNFFKLSTKLKRNKPKPE